MRLLLVGSAFLLVSTPWLGATVNPSEGRPNRPPLHGEALLSLHPDEITPVSSGIHELAGGLAPSAATAGFSLSPGSTPFYEGGGWIPPSSVAATTRNERTPSVVVDAGGNMWIALLAGDGPSSHIEIYRSADMGFTWSYVLGVYNSHNGPLGSPSLFVDPGPTPNIVYLAFSSFWRDDRGSGRVGLEVASFASDRPTETFQSVWVSAHPNFDLSEVSLSVERGHGPENRAFVATRAVNWLTGVQYLWAFKGSRYTSWSKILSVGGERRYRGGPEIWSTDRATYLVYIASTENSLPENAKRIHILATLDRGQSWKAVYADAPYPVAEVSVAGAQGRNEALAFAALRYGKADHDVYAFYTTDLGMSWGGYWMDTDNQDARLPRVSPDGVQFDAEVSAVFYFTEYHDRENDGLGNIKFLMCMVGDVTERANWRLPDGSNLDSLVISNESLYGVEPARGCLYLAARSESGGTMPVVAWNTPYISLTGDVYFARPIAPVYIGVKEEDGVAQEGIRVLFIPSERALRIEGELPPGSQMRLYSVDGRLVASLGLSPQGKTTTVRLPELPEGVYLWRLLGTGGRVSVIR